MRISRVLLAGGFLFSCQTPKVETKANNAMVEASHQWLALPQSGLASSLAQLCPSSYTCEASLASSFPVSAPFQEAGVLQRKSSAGASQMIALKLGEQWFGVEPESTPQKEKDKTSRVTHTFTAIQSKTIQQKPALLIQGTRREEVFCDTCANPISRTTPSTIYESEFLKICIAGGAQQVVCTDTFDSAHDQDGPTTLSFEVKEDGSIQLSSPTGRFTKEKRIIVEPGVYTVRVKGGE